MQNDEIIISDEELKSLTGAIQIRHGIDFNCYEPKSLKRRFARALTVFKLNSVHELWIRILRDPSFIYPLLDEISVGLTSMFRDPEVWKKLKCILINEWGSKSSLSLWHAGCSTGEEVYTMGIVLRESGFKGIVRGYATDISNQAMRIAKEGVYDLRKIPEFEKNYKNYNNQGSLQNFFKSLSDSSVVFDNSLIQHITFRHHNLIVDPFFDRYDLIFCRNVMIYFDMNTKINLLNKFYEHLNQDGLLIIGYYDAIAPLLDPLKFATLDLNLKIFKKINQKLNIT